MDQEKAGWNLFARELQQILETRQQTMWNLVSQAGIHREIVRRLVFSLQVPKSFPTLSPKDLKLVETTYKLDNEEMLRLLVAIMATSVEATLMGRIASDLALEASEQVFMVILRAMKSDASAQQMLSFLERSTSPVFSSQPIDEALEDAFTALDEGQISLHISFSAITQFEQLNCAHRAQDMFSRAITELDKVNERTHNSEEWQFWRSEAEHGLAIAVTQVTRIQSTRGSIL